MNFNIADATKEWAAKSKLPCHFEGKKDSTNHWAKEFKLDSSSPITLFICDHQLAGRGRSENSWADVPGACLLSSWTFQVAKSPQPVQAITIGLAVYNAFSATWPYLHWSLKAPNDLYLGSHKVAGLLIENVSQGSHNRLIIGLGANVHNHPQIANATSIDSVLKGHGTSINANQWDDLLDRLLLELSLAVAHGATSAELGLTKHESLSVLHALNKRPGAQEKFLDLDSQGTLTSDKRTILWSEL